MKLHTRIEVTALAALAVGAVWIYFSRPAHAHCDTMDGPVVKAARLALSKGEVTPVLRWIKPDDEPAIRYAFKQALAVRTGGPQARELADRYFFETLVRVHRAGEGEPYTGLKPAGTPVELAIKKADEALAKGSVDELAADLGRAAQSGVRKRFDEALEKKKSADSSVSAGREFVEAYVEFTHYVESLDRAAKGGQGHHGLHD